MKSTTVVALVCVVLAVVSSSLAKTAITPNLPKLPTQFESQITVTTSLTGLSLKGNFYYDYDAGLQRFDSNIFGVTQTELDIFNSSTRYVFETGAGASECQECTLQTSMFPLFVLPLSTYEGQYDLDGTTVDKWSFNHPVFDLQMYWWVEPTTPSLVQADFVVGDVSTTMLLQSQISKAPNASLFIPPTICGPTICNAPANIIFLVDGSGSITATDFSTMKNFLLTIIQSFEIGTSSAEIGVIQFSDYPVTAVSLSANENDIVASIQSMSQIAGGTDLGSAINSAASMLTNAYRSEIPNLLVILTDGSSSDDPIGPATTAKADGVEIFCVGIGSADVATLQQVASPPVDTHFFNPSNFNDLQNQLNGLVNSTCTNSNCDATTPRPRTLEPFRPLWSKIWPKA